MSLNRIFDLRKRVFINGYRGTKASLFRDDFFRFAKSCRYFKKIISNGTRIHLF